MFIIIRVLFLKLYLKPFIKASSRKLIFYLKAIISDSLVLEIQFLALWIFWILKFSKIFRRAEVIKEVFENIKWTFNKYYQIIRKKKLGTQPRNDFRASLAEHGNGQGFPGWFRYGFREGFHNSYFMQLVFNNVSRRNSNSFLFKPSMGSRTFKNILVQSRTELLKRITVPLPVHSQVMFHT